MKVGDMVVRAYAYHGTVPGVILEETIQIVTDTAENYSYEECYFIVHWSDGTITRELFEELDYLEDALNYVSPIPKK